MITAVEVAFYQTFHIQYLIKVYYSVFEKDTMKNQI